MNEYFSDEDEEQSDPDSDDVNSTVLTKQTDATQKDIEMIAERKAEAQPLVAKTRAKDEENVTTVKDDLLLLDLDFGSPSTNVGTFVSKWTRATAQYVPDQFRV